MAAARDPYLEIEHELQLKLQDVPSEDLAEIKIELKPMNEATRYSLEKVLEHLAGEYLTM